jgi:RHS repeat-associated protein
LFTDQEYDAESGLYNYDARLYYPVVGRFISADSIVPNSYNPQLLNRYAYCYHNPLRYKDPSGHFAIGIGFGAVAGGISGAIAGMHGSNRLASAITGGIVGGIAGAVVGGIVGAVAPQASSTAAATTVGAISGALGGVTGGFAARGTAAAFDAKAKNTDPVEAAIDAAADPSSMAADGIVGAASGAMGGMAGAAAGFVRMGQVAEGIVGSSTGRALGLAAGVATISGNSAGGVQSVDADNDDIGRDGSGSGGGFDGEPGLGL